MRADLNKPERSAAGGATEKYHKLLGSISATRPSSFVKAVLERFSTVVPEEIGPPTHLVNRHGKRDEVGLLQIPRFRVSFAQIWLLRSQIGPRIS
jgi:hypothetical protein